jgi:hypothetical protein
MKIHFANLKILLSVGPAQKPDVTAHSLNIENDESVFAARVVTFFQECRLLWVPGSSAGVYF